MCREHRVRRVTTARFNRGSSTLGYFEKLKAAGVPEQQAKAQIEVIRKVIEDRLATKKDLLDLESRLNSKMKELEYRLVIRLGGMMAASIAIVAVLVKLA